MSRKKTGCQKCMVAKQIKGENGEITFDTPKPIKDLEEFSYNYTYAEGSNYADNRQNIYKKKPTGADINLTFSDVSLEMEADLMGKKYNAGGASTNINDQAKQVALLLQETYDDGSYKNKVFYNVKLSKDENSGKSEGENIDFTPTSLVGRALALTNAQVDGDIDFEMDSADPKVNKVKLDAFFEAVQFNTEATIEVLYTGYTSGEVTEISLSGVTFETSSKKFMNVPSSATSFTFKLDSTTVTATKGESSWSFA